jgi:hypothetical protein
MLSSLINKGVLLPNTSVVKSAIMHVVVSIVYR